MTESLTPIEVPVAQADGATGPEIMHTMRCGEPNLSCCGIDLSTHTVVEHPSRDDFACVVCEDLDRQVACTCPPTCGTTCETCVH